MNRTQRGNKVYCQEIPSFPPTPQPSVQAPIFPSSSLKLPSTFPVLVALTVNLTSPRITRKDQLSSHLGQVSLGTCL